MNASRIILIFTLLLTGITANAQTDDTLFVRYDIHNSDSVQYTTDTLFRKSSFGPHYMFETDWITNTRNQLGAIAYGLYPLNVESDCHREGIESGDNELIYLEKNDSVLTVKYLIATNCCYHFLCDMDIVDSTTLNLMYIEYGTICGCSCFHELTFEIEIDLYDEEYELNFKKLKYVTLNNKLKAKLN